MVRSFRKLSTAALIDKALLPKQLQTAEQALALVAEAKRRKLSPVEQQILEYRFPPERVQQLCDAVYG